MSHASCMVAAIHLAVTARPALTSPLSKVKKDLQKDLWRSKKASRFAILLHSNLHNGNWDVLFLNGTGTAFRLKCIGSTLLSPIFSSLQYFFFLLDLPHNLTFLDSSSPFHPPINLPSTPIIVLY